MLSDNIDYVKLIILTLIFHGEQDKLEVLHFRENYSGTEEKSSYIFCKVKLIINTYVIR